MAGVGLSDCSCFQTQVGETECFGRSGATVIITSVDVIITSVDVI